MKKSSPGSLASDWLGFGDPKVAELARRLYGLAKDKERATGKIREFFGSNVFLELFEKEYKVKPTSNNDLYFIATEELTDYPGMTRQIQEVMVNCLEAALLFDKDVVYYMRGDNVSKVEILVQNKGTFPRDDRWAKFLDAIKVYPAFIFAIGDAITVRSELGSAARSLSALTEGKVKEVVQV